MSYLTVPVRTFTCHRAPYPLEGRLSGSRALQLQPLQSGHSVLMHLEPWVYNTTLGLTEMFFLLGLTWQLATQI
jgi:hypothetical protein